jgi:hypothetical protein
MDEITVICDDSGHARGKIATIATVARGPDGWDVLVSRRDGAPRRTLAIMYSTGEDVRRRDRFDLGPCKLCRRRWQRGTTRANEIFDALAERGVSEISLADLES